MTKTINILGLMSGSSLDGLDIAHCRFELTDGEIASWSIVEAKTYTYSEEWQVRLLHLPEANALAFARTDTYFGYYMAGFVQDFLTEFPSKIDFIASHGHTIFHDPQRQMTTQIGNGGAIAGFVGKDVICDFRSTDIALGGEGTPLAHVIDRDLFSEYKYCLNLGGIANMTIQENGKQRSFDICPANQILNQAAQLLDLPYDDGGKLAKSGKIDEGIKLIFNNFEYYQRAFPKSLGNGEIKKYFYPIIGMNENLENVLATAVDHITTKIAEVCDVDTPSNNAQMLITGGGAFNTFLIEELQHKLKSKNINCHIPDNKTIMFKESLLIALLGLLRIYNKTNCYADVTSARRDSVNGAVYRG